MLSASYHINAFKNFIHLKMLLIFLVSFNLFGTTLINIIKKQHFLFAGYCRFPIQVKKNITRWEANLINVFKNSLRIANDLDWLVFFENYPHPPTYTAAHIVWMYKTLLELHSQLKNYTSFIISLPWDIVDRTF